MLEFPRKRRLDRIRGNRQARMLTVTSNGSRKGIQPKCTVAGGCDSPTGSFARAFGWWRVAPHASQCASPDLRPCTDGYAYTEDGWRLGVRHYRPEHPDPGKLPVILCHGLGLNATFWTITDNHLPAQLAAVVTRSTSSTSGARAKMPSWGDATGSTSTFARPF